MVCPWMAGMTLPPMNPNGDTMFAKTILALVLAGVSLSFVANASAAPKRSQQAIEFYQTDYRHSATDTSGNGN